MERRRLGRTGLEVSVLSLGSGGPNRLGQSRYVSRRRIDRLIGRALDLGVNLFDTSPAYEESEVRLSRALRKVPRTRYLVASKVFPWRGGRLMSAVEIRRSVEHSLERLGIDELDLLHLHRVTPETYEITRDRVLPVLQNLRAEGKIRYLGISESTSRDPRHHMLRTALQDDLYDAVMVSYHPANPTAEQQVFPRARDQDVGILCMAVARHYVPRTFSARLQVLGQTLAGCLVSPPRDINRLRARLTSATADLTRRLPNEWVLIENDTEWGLPELLYAFALAQPSVTSVLTGTTDPDHLERNVLAARAPAPSHAILARLRTAWRKPDGGDPDAS